MPISSSASEQTTRSLDLEEDSPQVSEAPPEPTPEDLAVIKPSPADEAATSLTFSERYDPEFDEADIKYVNNYFSTMQHSPVATSSLICRGSRCEIVDSCPLKQLGKSLPVGDSCPIEGKLLEIWTAHLSHELGEELSHVDHAQVAEYVRAKLYSKRSHEILAKSDLVVDAFRGRDPTDGMPIYEKKLHPLIYLFEKTGKTTKEILESLIATRDAKSRDKSRESTSAAKLAATVLDRMRLMEADDEDRRFLDKARGRSPVQVIDADFEPLSPDPKNPIASSEDV